MASSDQITILLVDSDTIQRKSEFSLIQEFGFKAAHQADNGTEAWSIIKNFDVDLIICAWQLLTDMSGLGLLKVIRTDEAYERIPFLMIVEQVTRRHVLEAGSAGVTDMVLRPVTREIFQKKVENTLYPEETPQSAESKRFYKQGVDLIKQGKYEDALDSFKSILSVNESAEVYYNLGFIRTAQARYEEALIAFRRATEINQAFAQAYRKMAEVYAKLGRKDEASQCFSMAAEIYLEKKMDQEAEDAFLQVLKVTPNTPNVYNSLGIVYRRQGKLEDAVKMYHKALKVNPFDENIHYNLARAYMAVKKFRESAEILKKALKINPDFVEAYNLLQSIEMGEGLI